MAQGDRCHVLSLSRAEVGLTESQLVQIVECSGDTYAICVVSMCNDSDMRHFTLPTPPPPSPLHLLPFVSLC